MTLYDLRAYEVVVINRSIICKGYKYATGLVPDFFGNQDSQGVGNGINIFFITSIRVHIFNI